MAIFNATVPADVGGTEYEEGVYVPTTEQSANITINFSNAHSKPPAFFIITLTNKGTVSTGSYRFYTLIYQRYDRALGMPVAQSDSSFSIYGQYAYRGAYDSTTSSFTSGGDDTFATATGFRVPLSSSLRMYANNVYAWCAYWGEH